MFRMRVAARAGVRREDVEVVGCQNTQHGSKQRARVTARSVLGAGGNR